MVCWCGKICDGWLSSVITVYVGVESEKEFDEGGELWGMSCNNWASITLVSPKFLIELVRLTDGSLKSIVGLKNLSICLMQN